MSKIKLVARTPFYRALYIHTDSVLEEMEEDFNLLFGEDGWEYMKTPMSRTSPKPILVVKTNYGRLPVTPGSWVLVDHEGNITTHGYKELSMYSKGFSIIQLTGEVESV